MKTLYIVAGANGSGKTTFAANFAKLENLEFINADEIAKQYDPNDIQKYKVKAGKAFFRELENALQKSDSFMIETTLSGKYLIEVIKKAKEMDAFLTAMTLLNESPITMKFMIMNY